MLLLNSACQSLASNLFQDHLHNCYRLKGPETRWARGRDPGGIQASDYCHCLFLTGESPILSNVEAVAEASSLPPQQREWILPIYYVLWQLETKMPKSQNHPHEDKPVPEHGCSWLSNLTVWPLLLTVSYVGGEGGGRHLWGLAGEPNIVLWAFCYTNCNWRESTGL